MRKDEIEYILEQSRLNQSVFEHNSALFNIYEGDLLSYVLADLRKSLSPRAYLDIQDRMPPINILRRLIDKLSKIYICDPIREITPDSEKNKALFDWYVKQINPSNVFGQANVFFNLFKNTLIEPYIFNSKPAARVIPSDRFFVYSNDSVNPNVPTHYLKFMGKKNGQSCIYLYTDQEFLIINDKGEIQREQMAMAGNPDGINPYGKAPFVYVNRSNHNLIPMPDTDMLAMTKLIPVLLGDLAYAIKYQSFSVIWGIDINFENLDMQPNALWSMKSDPTSDKNPQIGTLKPSVDIAEVLSYVSSLIALWFQTKNIKAGSIDTLNVNNASSGIAKAIDEADTSEDRTVQTKYFKKAEEDFYSLIVNNMHPVWSADKSFGAKQAFDPGTEVIVTFPEQKPLVDSSQVQKDSIELMKAGLISKEKALSQIYPDASSEEIHDILVDAEEDKTQTPTQDVAADVTEESNAPAQEQMSNG